MDEKEILNRFRRNLNELYDIGYKDEMMAGAALVGGFIIGLTAITELIKWML